MDDAPLRSKAEWLGELSAIFAAAIPLLRTGAHVVTFVGDLYKEGRYHHTSGDLFRALEELGLTPLADLIWYDVAKKLHLYGYRYKFIPSMIHQSVLVFRKDT